MARSPVVDGRHLRQILFEEQIKEKTLAAMGNATEARPGPNRTIIRGRISNDRCQTPLSIHTSDTIEVRDHQARAQVQPGMTVSVILAGKVSGSIGGMPIVLDASDGPAGYLWSVAEPLPWTREIRRDTRVRKANISVRRDWLLGLLRRGGDAAGGHGALRALLAAPPHMHRWTPSHKALALAEALIDPPEGDGILRTLRLESRALEILGEALSSLTPPGADLPPNAARGAARVKAQRIRDFIEGNIHRPLTLAGVARELAMGVGSLQRTFKTAYGITVMDYIRERRMVAARDALERDGLTIAQAAHLAGYSSPANFATAFKRVFGLSPSDLKG